MNMNIYFLFFSIEDIMLHARLLAGTLGIDLSMLGFADQLSGGLGDGGFFRMSAQIAESSRVIRASMADFLTDLIDKHMLYKYGKCWTNANSSFQLNYYGSISAFESERQQTRSNAVGSAGIMAQTLEQMKNLGFSEKEMVLFMTKQMMLDQDEASIEVLKKLARKYYPTEELITDEIMSSGRAVQMFEIDIEHFSGKEVQEK